MSSAFKASSACSNHDVLPAMLTSKRNPMWNYSRSISSAKFFYSPSLKCSPCCEISRQVTDNVYYGEKHQRKGDACYSY